MQKTTKKAIATALRSIATVLDEDADNTPNPLTTLFDHGDALKATPATSSSNTVDPADLSCYYNINSYFHETVGKSTRTLNHSLNKVNKDWQFKNVRTPRGPRALVEVAADCSLDVKEMCEMILAHPKFSTNAIGEAATALLAQLA